MNLRRLRHKLTEPQSLRVLFLNDVGFQYGAGIAHLRQIQSFLLLGADVYGLCWVQGVEGGIPFVPRRATGRWMGMQELPDCHPSRGVSQENMISTLLEAIRSVDPDLILVGNLHCALWPLELLEDLKPLEAVTVAYMHDLYLVTGRCAYPGCCTLYHRGCDSTCPTAHEYPVLAPDRIAGAWELRRRIFCGPEGIPLATNSQWTLSRAKESMPGLHFADVVYLGLDTDLFRPVEKSLARRLLGLPAKDFIILAGAIDLADRRKGGALLDSIRRQLNGSATLLLFGVPPDDKRGIFFTGLQRDYRKMPLIYSAADLFLCTAMEEAFGQTLCEAAACAVPILAGRTGGIEEACVHELNAILIPPDQPDKFVDAIRKMKEDDALRGKLGAAGRLQAEQIYSLHKQGERWWDYLERLSSVLNQAS